MESSSNGRQLPQKLPPLQRMTTMQLEKLTKQTSVESTNGLIAAANCADTSEQAGFAQWLSEYVAWFSERPVDVLNKDVCMEYALLADLDAEIPLYKELLRSWLISFCNKIKSSSFGTGPVITAFSSSLSAVPASILEETIDPLLRIANHFISGINPEDAVMTAQTYETHNIQLNAAFRVLTTIQDSVPPQFDSTIDGGPYQRLKKLLNQVIEVQKYFPYLYQAEMVKHCLSLMELKPKGAHKIARDRKKIKLAFCGAFRILAAFKKLADIEFDFASFRDGMQELADAVRREGSERIHWCSLIGKISYGCVFVCKDPSLKDGLFDAIDSLIEENSTDSNAVCIRFGIADELILLINNLFDRDVQLAALQRLLAIGQKCHTMKNSEGDVLTLNAIMRLLKRMNLSSLEDLKNLIDDPPGDMDLKNMIFEISGTNLQSDILFRKIRKSMGWEGSDGIVETIRSELKQRYQDDAFVRMAEFIEGGQMHHVSDLDSHLMLTKEAQNVTNSGEFFKTEQHNSIISRDLFRDVDITERDIIEVQRVVILGHPGTGKTLLSRKIACMWSKRVWGKQFDTLFVIPVRDIRSEEYTDTDSRSRKTLPTAIAKICFEHRDNDVDFDRLVHAIAEELEKDSTLVVLDGLDEAAAACQEIVDAAMARSNRFRLLAFGRPGGIDDYSLFAREVECIGLDETHLMEYIRRNLDRGKANRLINQLNQNRNLKELAHVPVNLIVLCALTREQDDELIDATGHSSLLSIYEGMSLYMWRRYVARHPDLIHEGDCFRNEMFDILEKIALESMKNDKIDVCLNDLDLHSQSLLRNIGFLFVQFGKCFQFMHLTFMEYFAARALVKNFFGTDETKKSEAQQLLSKYKYKQRYLQLFQFTAAQAVKTRGWEGLDQIFRTMDNGSIEITTAHHFILKSKLMDSAMSISGNPSEDKWNLTTLRRFKAMVNWIQDSKETQQGDEERLGTVGAISARFLWSGLRLVRAMNFLNESAAMDALAGVGGLCSLASFGMSSWYNVIRSVRRSSSAVNALAAISNMLDKWPVINHASKALDRLQTLPSHFQNLTDQDISAKIEKVKRNAESNDWRTRYLVPGKILRIVRGETRHDELLLQLLEKLCYDQEIKVVLSLLVTIPMIIISVLDWTDKLIDIFVDGFARAGGIQIDFLRLMAEALSEAFPQCQKKLNSHVSFEPRHKERYQLLICHTPSPEQAIENWFREGNLCAIAGILQTLPLMIMTVEKSQIEGNLKLVLQRNSKLGYLEWDKPRKKVQDLVLIFHGLFKMKECPEVAENMAYFTTIFGEGYLDVQ